ncbi:MAG: hypothetical protein NTW52_16765 [Planctomycetota bacterium]|nr:hypothetical protein [Planctomycetota bacterium]
MIILIKTVVKTVPQKTQRKNLTMPVQVNMTNLYKLRALRSLRHPWPFLVVLIYLTTTSIKNVHAQYALPANGVATPPAPPIVTAPTGVYVQTNVDPATGKQIDIYLEHEAVPVLKWEQQEVTERRFVPQWVHETQKTTEVQYIPSVSYQTQAKNLNAWNPLLPPRIAYEYIPVTQYQTVNQVVDKPITYQKYVDQEVKVVVPKLVQVTEQRAKYTQRERNAPAQTNVASNAMPLNNGLANSQSSSLRSAPSALSPEQQSAQSALANRNTLSTSYVTRPIQGPANTPTYPYSSYAAKTTPTTNQMLASMPQTYYAAPAYPPQQAYPQQSYPPVNNFAAAGYQPSYQPNYYQPSFTPVAYQQPVPWGQNTTAAMMPNPYPSPYPNQYPNQYSNPNAYNGSYPNPTSAYAQSWFQMPSWISSTGPLLSQNMMSSSSYLSYNPNSSMMATGYSAQQPNSNVAYNNPSMPPVAASPGNYSDRDAMQAGLQPSVLR